MISRTLTLILLIGLISVWPASTALALSDGPSQPEAMQFEPVDTTDLVNLTTGDFTYGLPLLSVPGPGGDYPLNLSYHAGIGTNQDATWVGLGWSLNPGAINRTINGYPDDYNKVWVQNHFQAPQKEGTAIGIGIGYGPVGLNLKYDSYVGTLGINASYSFSIMGVSSLTLSAGTDGVDASGHLGIPIAEGVNVGLSIGTQGASLSGKVALPLNSSIGFSLSSAGANGNFSLAGLGIRGITESSRGNFTSSSFGLMIPTPWGITVNLSTSQWKWVLNETHNDLSFGYANATEYLADARSNKRFERVKHGLALFPSQDFYVANAQGLSGTFMPFTTRSYTLRDDWQNTEKGKLRERVNRNYETVFKFLDDQGANLITSDGGSTWGKNYEQLFPNRYGSKIIKPIWSDPTRSRGEILGFVVTTADGKVYEFQQAVKNHFQFSYQTNDYPFHFTGSAPPDPDYPTMTEKDLFYNYNVLPAPYVTNWLLTAIKGPDYLDRNGNRVCDEDDWGYWVKLSYSVSSKPQVWRSPYRNFAPSATSDESINVPGQFNRYVWSQHNPANVSVGARDVVYLYRVETASHLAEFVTSEAKDRFTPSLNRDRLRLEGRAINYTDSVADFNQKLAFAFPGRLVQFVRDTDPQTEILELRNRNTGGGARLRRNEIEPIDKGDQTYLRGDNSLRTRFPYLLSDYDVTLLFNNVLQNRVGGWKYTQAKKLDRIDLYAKADPNLRKIGGNWEILYNFATPIKSVKFTYDYSLCTGTPGSEATAADGADRGKLTLKGVEFLGRGKTSGGLPPYQFIYARGDQPGQRLNPEYHDYDWDNWGSYRSSHTPNTMGINTHETPQEKSAADMAAAWSLTEIITPTGGHIGIEYESDDYFYVNDYYDEVKAKFPFSSAEFQANRIVKAYVPSGSVKAKYRDPNRLELRLEPNQPRFAPGQFFSLLERSTFRRADGTVEVSWNEILARILDITPIAAGSGPNTILRIEGYSGFSMKPDRDYFVYAKREFYGGGIRVKSIESWDLSSRYKTTYTYRDEYGLSSGVTPTLPAKYNIVKVNFYGDPPPPPALPKTAGTEKYWKLFTDYKYNYGRPSPSVTYSRVEVMNVSANGQPLNGKSVHKFYTAHNYPYSPSFTGDEQYGTLERNTLSLVDESVYYGKPKETVEYELTPRGEFRTLKESRYDYTRSSTLYLLNRILSSAGNTLNSSSKPLGLTQEKYRYENQQGETQSSARTYSAKVERIFENLYMTGSRSTLWYYATPTDLDTAPRSQISTNVVNLYRDGLSGQVTASVSRGSDDRPIVTSVTPAHWVYSLMRNKNLLTQKAQETIYRISDDYYAFLNKVLTPAYTLPPEDIISSTVSTWIDSYHDPAEETDGLDSVWRVSRTYTYNKEIDRAAGDAYSPFNSWQPGSLYYPAVTNQFPWKLLSVITSYNPFSHPTEEFHEDGTSISSVYRYNGALPAAIVKNAHAYHVRYFDFEETKNLNNTQRSHIFAVGGKTGRNLATAKDRDWNHSYDLQLHQNIKYKVSFWAKKGTAALSLPPRLSFLGSTLPQNQVDIFQLLQTTDRWEYIEGTITPVRSGNVQMRILSGGGNGVGDNSYHYIDDIRIHPIEAAMRTFTYDPLSLQVTSTTDENNVSIYYEYDNWNRLIRIRDQDLNIVNNYTYQYGNERLQNLPSGAAYIAGNSIKKQQIVTPINTVPQLNRLTDRDAIQTIDYYTGLSKLAQTTLIRGSPSLKDFITPFTYDELGMRSTAYLPYVAGPGSGEFRADSLTRQRDFYRNQARVAHSEFPWSKTVFERSPLLRVKEQGAEGEAWQPSGTTPSSGHTVKTRYRTNGRDEVRMWKFDPARQLFTADSFYEPQQLKVTEREDEHGRTTTEYKDKSDTLVYKKGLNDIDYAYIRERDDYLLREVEVGTYYIYDQFHNLRFVLPPMAVAAMAQANNWTINNTVKDLWATELIYDGYQRLIEKRVAGFAPAYTVYDSMNRPILFQDGKLRLMNRWLFTKYDVLGRPIITGIYHDATHLTRLSMQNFVNSYVNNTSRFFYEKRVETAGSSFSMNFDSSQGYSNQAFPMFSGASTVRTVTYYDDYDFNNNGRANDDYTFTADPEFPDNKPFFRVKNLVTGKKTKVEDGSATPQWLTTVYFYDKYYRVIQSVSRHLKGITVTNNQYDFSGRLLKTKTLHNTADPLLVRKRYEYDHVGRLTRVYQQNNNDAEVLIVENRYNELGQIMEKNLYSEDRGLTFLQSVDFARNIRGWLTHINNNELSNDRRYNDDTNDLFGMKLNYEEGFVPLSTTPQYVGNVSSVRWRSRSDNQEKAYSYLYDRLGQLTRARYSSLSGNTWDNENRYSLSHAGYDLNGNLQILKQNGATMYSSNHRPARYGLMDELRYFYQGNRLIGVNDAVGDIANNQNFDFSDRGHEATPNVFDFNTHEYLYDLNGNMVQDKNKGMTITYNFLNLPTVVDFGGGNKIEWLYSATGEKLRKKVSTLGTVTRTVEYAEGVIYEENHVSLFTTNQGHVARMADGTLRYELDIVDHLGNIRVTFAKGGSAGTPLVIEENHYFPFGLKLPGLGVARTAGRSYYAFNGKEMEDDLGLNWYHYGARFYDPQLGRWHMIDPADNAHSPYVYVNNNPINSIDPDGQDAKLVNNPWYWPFTPDEFEALSESPRYKAYLPTIPFISAEERQEVEHQLNEFQLAWQERAPKVADHLKNNEILVVWVKFEKHKFAVAGEWLGPRTVWIRKDWFRTGTTLAASFLHELVHDMKDKYGLRYGEFGAFAAEAYVYGGREFIDRLIDSSLDPSNPDFAEQWRKYWLGSIPLEFEGFFDDDNKLIESKREEFVEAYLKHGKDIVGSTAVDEEEEP